MFDLIRNHQRWVQFILLLLILPSFVFVGIQGYTSFMNGDAGVVAKVAGNPITQQEFDASVRGQLDQMRAMLGDKYDPQAFDNVAARQVVLDNLVNARLVAAVAAKNNFSASDMQLRSTIEQIPALQENGKFNYDRYRAALAAQGLTPAAFSSQLRGEIAMQMVSAPVAVSAMAPQSVFDGIVAAATQRRDVQTMALPFANYTSKVVVTDDDVKTFYEHNQAAFAVPDRVDAQYVLLDQSSVAPAITVSDADVQGYYDQNKARFGQPEQRRASHILIQVDAKASDAEREAAKKKAQALADQARAPGADFAALARANSQDSGSAANGGDLDWFGPGMMVKPFEEAAFALKQGEVSGVVASDFGYHVIKLTGIRPGTVKPLAEVRQQIVDEIKQQQAARKFAEVAEQFTNMVYEQSDSLDPVAAKFNLKVQAQAGVTRAPAPGLAGAAAEVFGNPKVLQSLFSGEVLRDKRNSGVIELGPNKLVAVRAASYQPASVQPLDQVAERIRQVLVRGKALDLARADGEARIKALQGADSSDGFGKTLTVSRQDAQGLAPAVLGAVMKASADKLPAYVGAASDDAYVVARITALSAAPALPAATVENEKRLLERRQGQAEQAAMLRTLRDEYKVKITDAGQAALAGQASRTE